MAFVNLTAKVWGSSPDIDITPAYEMQRSGADMQYRIRVTVGTVSGQSYFGYPIYLKIYLQNSLKVTYTLKSASPSQWTSAIVYTSSWFTISNKTSGTTSLSLNIYSGSGSSRNSTYSYNLPIVAAGSVLGTVSSFTLGNAITIPITKYNSGFYDVLQISVGGTVVKTVNGITNGASVSFTSSELTTIYSKLPNVTSGTFTFKLTTKTSSSGSSVGTSSKTASGTIPSSVKPTISGITLAEATSGLASAFGAYIQNKSAITGTVNASAGSGSSISSYKTTVNGSSYTTRSFTTGVLKTIGTNTISTTVTDKRGRTATYSTTFTVIAYSKPSISVFKVERCNADGTLNDEGTAFKVTINSSITALNNKNTSTYTFQYKMSTSDSWTTVGTTLSGYAPNTNFVMTNIYLNIDTSYDFRLTVKDYFESVIKNVNVAESFTLINYSADGKGIAFGGVSEDSNAFDVKLDKMYFSNECFIGGAKRNDLEKNFYFQTREDAAIPSDCKIYGGNGSSSTSIGIWDVLNDIPVFRYFGPSKNFTFGEDINIRKGSLPLINQVVAVAAHNSGRIHYSNGLLIQWGIISITPTAANETTLVTITFPISYTYKPNCFVTPQTSAPTIQTLSIGQGSTTTTNFSIYMNRTNTTAITVHWLAVGYKEVT